MAKSKTRECTDKLLERLEDGILSWEEVCRECLAEMSEDDVADMCSKCEYLDDDDGYEEDED